MNGPRRQHGFLVIVAAVLIVVIGFLGVAITFLVSANMRAGAESYDAARALAVAEAGLEYGTYDWSMNGNTGPSTQNVGAGSFTFFADDNGSAFGLGNPLANPNQKRIVSVGGVGNATRTVEAVVESGGGGNMLTNEDFGDPGACPPEPTSWDLNPDWTGNDCNAFDNLSGNPAPSILSTKPGGNSTNQTNATQFFATPCTTASPTTFTVTFDYRYLESAPTGGANRGRIRVRLGRATGGWYGTGFTINDTIGWTSHPGLTINVPSNRTIDRFSALLTVRGNGAKTVWIDNIEVTGAGCSGSGGVKIIAWREVFP